MGIEDSTLDVEESTEPPLGGSLSNLNNTEKLAYRGLKSDETVGISSKTPTPGLSSISSFESLCTEKGCYADSHTVPAAIVAQVLGVDPKHGLARAEAASRLHRDGPNKVEGTKGLSMWKILLRQVSNSLTLVRAESQNKDGSPSITMRH
ncbi:hypothetical protein IWX46DRAFT_433952 [Phyllosticta citricarpa]|uniref:Cation-transporting P-type ATPase N-terminal domain-containing protein n=1 Tax=Phyllosticta citricarpa TaxID=55181 RepID=A0ABR1L2A8_9PEZI